MLENLKNKKLRGAQGNFYEPYFVVRREKISAAQQSNLKFLGFSIYSSALQGTAATYHSTLQLPEVYQYLQNEE